ncbi:hypothetical protein CGRA01v4_01983 [Colletotrichum graminicola]|nr:hypothetical protein CGRA01v4_01983 [Colletotrichum graminicola]
MFTKLLAYSLMGFAHLPTLLAETTVPPRLELPWGVYEGQPMADDPDNVRFGAKPPRFGAPSFPTSTSTAIQPVSDGRNCIQIDPNSLHNAPGGQNGYMEGSAHPAKRHVLTKSHCNSRRS